MLYKTMCLELLQDRPPLHEQLRQKRQLLATVNRLATALRDRHLAYQEQLSRAKPDSDPDQIASEVLESALNEMESCLPSALPDEDGPLSLDEAMAFLPRPTPPA